MNVTVKLLGVHQSIVGKESFVLNMDAGEKIGELVNQIPELVGNEAFRRILIDPELNDPRPNNVILVNGREISSLNGLETELKDGDEVVVIPLVHGGQSAFFLEAVIFNQDSK